MRLSTLYPHIARAYETLKKMADSNTIYVVDNGDDGIEIMEDGYITHENIRKFKFTFAGGQDITESLDRKTNEATKQVSTTQNGKTAYTPMTCTYPDGKSTSSKVILTECIIQYREGVERDNSNYAREYVSFGIPTDYIEKIQKDAKNNSSIKLGVKDKVERMEGYYWFNASLEKLQPDDTWIFFEAENGDDDARRGTVHEILKGMKTNMTVDTCITVSGSMTTQDKRDNMDLINGKYTFTIKLTEVFFKDVSEVKGPQLEDTNRRKREGANKSERFKASPALAQFALRNLSM